MKKNILLIFVGLFVFLWAVFWFFGFFSPEEKTVDTNVLTTENLSDAEKETDTDTGDSQDSSGLFGEKNGHSEEDTDGDGVLDWVEIELGLDPLNPDTDGDRVSDGQEIIDGTNPKDPKSFIKEHQAELIEKTDEQSLLTGEEVPLFVPEKDSDQDGLSDEEEIALGTDPFNRDTDGDGLIDGAEGGRFFKTDPLIFDTDGDGFGDGEEIFAGYDPIVPNATLDNKRAPYGSVGSQ